MASRIIRGDCREVLPSLSAGSVHCCVSSPPYWSLRSYLADDHPDKLREIGLEERISDYVANLRDVFEEVRRTLHPLGTLWLNLGDNYAGTTGLQRYSPERDNRHGLSNTGDTTRGQQKFTRNVADHAPVYRDFERLKPKDLCGVPWRVAFALQDAGWWLRADCIWRKPNPKTESVKDRPARGHEYLFLFSKSERYFYDHYAVREPICEESQTAFRKLAKQGKKPRRWRTRRTVWDIVTGCYPGAHTAVMPEELAELCIRAGTSEQGCCRSCLHPFERITSDFEDEEGFMESETQGWRGCSCPATEQIAGARCVVLDPFGGTGTTALMAEKLGHDSVIIELDPDTVGQANERNAQGGLGL